MITQHLNNTQENIKTAAEIIKTGGIIAFPTETVYGIGVDIFNEEAVQRIFAVKGRDFNKPLSAHISDIKMVQMVSDIIPDIFYELANIFLPGALTMIIKAKENIPSMVTAGTGTIAIRFPSNQVCKSFIDTVGFPLAATSANISGNSSAKNPIEVRAELDGKIDALIDDGDCELKIESTVISLLGKPTVIRAGAISIAEIEGKLGRRIIEN
jgi:L-threonylcarbamoyladenylate synthase